MDALAEKERMTNLFTKMGCDGSDGSFNTVANLDGTIQERIIKYNELLSEIIGIKMDIPKKLVAHTAKTTRGPYSEDTLKDAFTYAFIGGPGGRPNDFSYTLEFN